MDPNEAYKIHDNCANELYIFLDDAKNAPTTPEQVESFGVGLKEIVIKYGITALLCTIDNAIDRLLKSSDNPADFRKVKTKLVIDIRAFMRGRKKAILGRADNLGVSIQFSKPFIRAPFKIIFGVNGHNAIYINDVLVEPNPDDHNNSHWHSLLTSFIINEKLTLEDVKKASDAKGDNAGQLAVSRLRAVLRYNNSKRSDGIKVSIPPIDRYLRKYHLVVLRQNKPN